MLPGIRISIEKTIGQDPLGAGKGPRRKVMPFDAVLLRHERLLRISMGLEKALFLCCAAGSAEDNTGGMPKNRVKKGVKQRRRGYITLPGMDARSRKSLVCLTLNRGV
jgi:hypothetical protein